MTSRQLNIRLADVDRDRLEAIAFTRRTQAATLAREIINTFVAAHLDDPGVRTALAALSEVDQATQPREKVRRINPRS